MMSGKSVDGMAVEKLLCIYFNARIWPQPEGAAAPVALPSQPTARNTVTDDGVFWRTPALRILETLK